MPKPDRREIEEPSVSIGVVADKVPELQSVLVEIEQGSFNRPAQVCDWFRRDDRITGLLAARIAACLGSPLEVQPGTVRGRETRKTVKISEEIYEAWERIAPRAELARILRSGILLGVGVGEIVWRTDSGRWLPRVKAWHPSALNWDTGTLTYYVTDADGVRHDLPVTPSKPYGDGKWVVFTPYGFSHAWLEALFRPLAQLYLVRQWDWRDFARYSETAGMPIVKAIVPGTGGDIQDKNRFYNSLKNRGSELVVQCAQNDQGKGYDVSLVEASGHGWQTFDTLMKAVDSALGNLILGANSSGAKVSGLGSGQQNQDENVRGDLKRFDAQIAEAIRDQVLTWYTLHNYGLPAEGAPMCYYQVDPPADDSAWATMLQTVGTALPALDKYGADVDAILDRAGVPLLPEAEREEPEEEPPPPPPEQPPPEGDGEPPEGEAPPEGEEPEPPEETATRADTGDVVTLASKRTRRKVYADKLADKGRDRARQALAPDLASIQEEIAAASDYEDLRARLLKRFKRMNASAVEQVIERAEILADLAGRHDVLKTL